MVLRYQDIPKEFNVASYFVDRNIELGKGDRTALIATDRTTSYAELAALTNRVSTVLLRLGVRRGQRVLLILGDGLEFVASWYAVQKIGAVTAEVYTYLPPEDYVYYFRYTGAEVAIVDVATLDRIRAVGGQSHYPEKLLVVGANEHELRDGELSFDALVAEASDELVAVPTGRDDAAIWKFTTGSTGSPKACVLPARSPLLSFDWYALGVLGMDENDIVLPVPKLFFGYSRDLTTLFPFGVGGAGIVFPERTTADLIFDLVRLHRPTILVNVPTMMNAMVNHPAAAEQDLSCLRMCTSAGEALPEDLHRRWHDTFGVDVVDGIGSSEVYHIYVSNRPGQARPGSVGRAVPGYRARIVDTSGHELPDGEVGVLEVTGETVATEYWDDPEKTARTFVGDHTVRSGDLFERDTEGYFHYRGRADDLMKVGGVWVAPAEIERCLAEHPAVVDCAVVAGRRDGLVLPRAFVVLRQGAEASTVEIQEFVRDRLSPHKYPREVRFVTALPLTGSGKVDRRALRELP